MRTDADKPVGVELFDVDNKQAEGKSQDEIAREWAEAERNYPHGIW